MKKKGFSLVELVVVIVVLGIIMVVIYEFFFQQEKSLRRQRMWSELNMKGRKASTYIAREFRSVGYTASIFGTGDAFGIIRGNLNGIIYSHDVNGPQAGILDPEDIHSITISGDTLYIDGDFALDRIASLQFTYRDTTGNPVGPPIIEADTLGNWVLVGNPVENIEYEMRLASPFPRMPDTVDYNGSVSLRNKRP